MLDKSSRAGYAEAALTKAANAAQRVRDPRPTNPFACWAWIKGRAGGSLRARYFGAYRQCEREAMHGCLTCSTHRDREADAQTLKSRSEVQNG